MGHWDVSDMTRILSEAHGLVENGHIDDDDFKKFVFSNPASFYTRLNPDFFKGTRVEQQVAALVSETA
jgi:hypothetical protein